MDPTAEECSDPRCPHHGDLARADGRDGTEGAAGSEPVEAGAQRPGDPGDDGDGGGEESHTARVWFGAMVASFALATAALILCLGGLVLRWLGDEDEAGVEDTMHHVGDVLSVVGLIGVVAFAVIGFACIAVVAWVSRKD